MKTWLDMNQLLYENKLLIQGIFLCFYNVYNEITITYEEKKYKTFPLKCQLPLQSTFINFDQHKCILNLRKREVIFVKTSCLIRHDPLRKDKMDMTQLESVRVSYTI